jgi:hypothetical protein
MSVDKSLFAQFMVYVPRKTAGRIIDLHGGHSGDRTLNCIDLFRVLTFSQLS